MAHRKQNAAQKDSDSKHNHKKLIDAKDFRCNCRYHKNNKLIGFCKKCKIPLCDKCIIYIFKEKNNILNYHSIAHILKHKDFEIIRLNDIERKTAPSSRIISIGSEDNNDLSYQSNNNILLLILSYNH